MIFIAYYRVHAGQRRGRGGEGEIGEREGGRGDREGGREEREVVEGGREE